MKIAAVAVIVLLAAWLGLWVSSTGVLVSSSDTGVLKTRDCRYLVGVTVQRRLEPLAERCPFVRKVGR
jgi:phosphate/sulfate permease